MDVKRQTATGNSGLFSSIGSAVERFAKMRNSYKKRESAVMKKDPTNLESLKKEISEKKAEILKGLLSL